MADANQMAAATCRGGHRFRWNATIRGSVTDAIVESARQHRSERLGVVPNPRSILLDTTDANQVAGIGRPAPSPNIWSGLARTAPDNPKKNRRFLAGPGAFFSRQGRRKSDSRRLER